MVTVVLIKDGEPPLVIHGSLGRVELQRILEANQFAMLPTLHALNAPSLGCALGAIYGGTMNKVCACARVHLIPSPYAGTPEPKRRSCRKKNGHRV